MLYSNGQSYLEASQKSLAVFGMSGLGKTVISHELRETGEWFHYSVDYRIGSKYMNEPIADNLKMEAMKNPFLRDLLMKDSLHINAKMKFANLAPLSTYLGKPGNPELGGIAFDEYCKRQDLHREAEIRAMNDIGYFIDRAQSLYNYPHFIADCSGSLCEVLGDDIKNSELMKTLSKHALPVWIKGPEGYEETLIKRFQKNPKPMYYQRDFLVESWAEYKAQNQQDDESVNPDDFMRWGYARLIAQRLPRYQAMAQYWGVVIDHEDLQNMNQIDDLHQLIAKAIDQCR